MTNPSLTQDDRKWRIVFTAMFVLIVFTFATPIGSKAAVILPERETQILKLFARSLASILLLLTAIVISYRKNAIPILLKHGAIIGFSLWSISSFSWSAIPKESINQGGSFGILVLLSFLVSFCWNRNSDTKKVLKALSLMLLFISCGLLAMRFGAPQFGALTRDANGLLHSTASSASASLGLLIVLLSKLIWNWRWANQLLIINTLIQLTTIVVSGNRFSLALTFLVAGLATATLIRREHLAIAVLSIGLIGSAYILADPNAKLAEAGLKRVGVVVSQGQTSSEMKTISGRTEMWAEIWRSFKESPWTGHGYFVTSSTGEIYVWHIWGNWTAHNMWLQLLVTTGIIGAAIFATHLLVLGFSMIQVANSTIVDYRKYLTFSVFIFVWFLLWGFLNSSIFGPTSPETVVFFVLTGLLMGISSASHRRTVAS